jgi:hypothetical protein
MLQNSIRNKKMTKSKLQDMIQGRENPVRAKTGRVKSAQMDLPGSENRKKREFHDGRNREYQ